LAFGSLGTREETMATAAGEGVAAPLALTQQQHRVSLQIPFPTERLATIACETLSVDKEPKRSECVKSLSVDGTVLNM